MATGRYTDSSAVRAAGRQLRLPRCRWRRGQRLLADLKGEPAAVWVSAVQYGDGKAIALTVADVEFLKRRIWSPAWRDWLRQIARDIR